MEQRKKIVIPLGEASKEAGGAPPSRTPFFDEEATMGARPVVPIVEASAPQPRHLPLLALVVILAVSAGLAGGFLIGLYKSGQNKQSASAPAATATTTAASTEQAAQTPAQQQQLPAAIASEKSSAPQPRTVAAEGNATTERAARDNGSKRDEDKVLASAEVRERAEEKRDREEKEREDRIVAREEERESRRQQRQERRRRAREREAADSGDMNQQIERGTRELNRIREIFEGQRP
jgi:type IV secretory pathway VirB10-like protein